LRVFIHTARQHEAKPLIKGLHLRRFQTNSPFPIYYSEEYYLIVSGEGKVNTSAAIAYLAALFLPATNLPWISVGEIVCPYPFLVNKVLDSNTRSVWYPTLLFPWKNTHPLVTLEQLNQPEPLPKEYYYDLESSAFFQIANKFSPLELVHSIKFPKVTKEDIPLIKELFTYLKPLANELLL
jgi:hypothetical protein